MTAHPLRAPLLPRTPPVAANGGDPRTSDIVDGVYYPSSDGKPMAENTAQWTALVVDGAVLDCRYADDPNVLVAGDVLVYPRRGDPRNSVVPDILVAFGVPKRPHRPSYKVWVEGKAPDFVMEVASPGTWKEDRGRKWQAYEAMGVGEYWLFDPTGEFFDPPLEGYRLAEGRYVPVEALGEAPELVLASEVLGLHLRPGDGHVRFHDPATGEDLRTLLEEAAERRRESSAHRREAAARRRETAARRKAEEKAAQAHARVAELEALVRQLRGQSEP